MANSQSNKAFEFPPYTYVPGVTPHPISDPKGHMHKQSDDLHAGFSNANWMQWGQALFDGGFYWEAHEAWEHLWIELGRQGPDADCVKGLIKLAACGVKILEANKVGALRHANRSLELLSAATSQELLGLDVFTPRRIAEEFVSNPKVPATPSTGQPRPVEGFAIQPSSN